MKLMTGRVYRSKSRRNASPSPRRARAISSAGVSIEPFACALPGWLAGVAAGNSIASRLIIESYARSVPPFTSFGARHSGLRIADCSCVGSQTLESGFKLEQYANPQSAIVSPVRHVEQHVPGEAAVEPLGQRRVEGLERAVLLEGHFALAQREARDAEVVTRRRVSGVCAHRGAETPERLGAAARRVMRDAEAVARRRVIRLQADGLFQKLDGLRATARLVVSERERVVRLRPPRREADGAA